MVVLRLKRFGRRHRPFYRLCAMDKRAPRNGRVIEELGWYDPLGEEEKQAGLKIDRIDHWLSLGAQPSRTVASLLRKSGCDPKPGKELPPKREVPAEPPSAATAPLEAPPVAPAEGVAEASGA